MSSFKGKKTIVFGGTSGIGLEVAEQLAQAGGDVVTVSRRSPAAQDHQNITHETADLLDRDALTALFKKHHGFNYLVNTATGGRRAIGPFLEMDLDGFQASFAKLWGYTNSVRLGTSQMAKDGAIVLLSGYPARKWRPGVTALGTVGNAVEGFIRMAANEIAPVRINGVSPGLIDTPMIQLSGVERQEYLAQTTQKHLIARAGQVGEVASAVLFLLENRFITGTIVDVDGGAIVAG